MRVFGWYERRLALQPSRRAGCGVSVAAEPLEGGSLLQRACGALYTERHVRLLAATLGRALATLKQADVSHVDLTPWSLLYAAPAALHAERGALHAGLTLTNVGLGARARRARRRAGCAAFDAPEVRRGGAPPDARAALWTLGCVLHLLLTGAPYEPDAGVDSLRSHALWAHVSADARAVVASLVRPDPAARLGLDDLLSLPWVESAEPLPSPPRPAPHATPPRAGEGGGDGGAGAERLLVEAHEALNAWYDGFVFDGVCEALGAMCE
eukprot:Transcript_24568.p3 GENE.Transcript_24568~~Transcript_24568.p3  ORF type:complete len:268 (+),score=102.58 Transcript_24568:1695-2498(+)